MTAIAKNIPSQRDSGIELLRIIAMIMILVLHADFKSLGIPTQEETVAHPLPSFLRIAFEMLAIIGVNVFVMISGWFEITMKRKGLAKFLFQVIFILTATYIIGLIIGKAELNLRSMLQCVFIGDNAWFVKSYLALYILSPVLNAFCKHASKRQFQIVLIGFFLFQTIWAAFSGNYDFSLRGYSAFSFIGLYLLMRYIRLHKIAPELGGGVKH